MAAYRFTDYFENEVLRKRPYLKREWCIRVIEKPIRSEPQESNRYRFWAEVPELEGRFLRVITLEDQADGRRNREADFLVCCDGKMGYS